MKEKLKQENEQLKKIKQNLKDVQEKQKHEKEVISTFFATVLFDHYFILIWFLLP